MNWIKRKSIDILVSALVSLLELFLSKEDKKAIQNTVDSIRDAENLKKWYDQQDKERSEI